MKKSVDSWVASSKALRGERRWYANIQHSKSDTIHYHNELGKGVDCRTMLALGVKG